MELFSEIYSAYYEAVSHVLGAGELDERDIRRIISERAFGESAFYLMPYLKNEWKLLTRQNGKYASALKHGPQPLFTLLEKRWLRAVLNDPKARLFLDDEDISRLCERLGGVKPLFDIRHFHFFDRFSDGDDFLDENYINTFRTVLGAIKSRRILNIDYISRNGKSIRMSYLPLKLEYSPKNDKFRVFGLTIRHGRLGSSGIINMSRIEKAADAGKSFEDIDLERAMLSRRCSEPVCVEISSERNGIERFMLEFASYEKQTESDDTAGKCTARIWYNSSDETELLIRLLSFGPVLEIKAPERFRRLAKERIYRQAEYGSYK